MWRNSYFNKDTNKVLVAYGANINFKGTNVLVANGSDTLNGTSDVLVAYASKKNHL